MKSYERALLPHAVYRFYNRNMELLYVGCSHNLCSRLSIHGSSQPWIMDLAAVKVTWYPDLIQGRRAEANAILTENPRYNKLRIESDAVGTKEMAAYDHRPRGDGLTCPKCGNPKQRRTAAYCNQCYKAYRQRKKLDAAATAG